MLPRVLDAADRLNHHPLTYSGSAKATDWVQSHGMVMPGNGLLVAIPTTWMPSDISDPYVRSNYESGRLEEGGYCVDALMTVELETRGWGGLI